MSAVVTLDGVCFTFDGASGPVLESVDLAVAPGATVVLLGASGSGRTTLARILAGVVAPGDGVQSGEVHRAAGVRAALVAADPALQLTGLAGTVEEELALGLEHARLPREEMRARIARVAGRLGLGAELPRDPAVLSGGRRQLVALAAALVLEPALLVLDDVSRHLDPASTAALLVALEALRADRPGLAVVATDTDAASALSRTAHSRFVLADGRLHALGRGGRARSRLREAGVRTPFDVVDVRERAAPPATHSAASTPAGAPEAGEPAAGERAVGRTSDPVLRLAGVGHVHGARRRLLRAPVAPQRALTGVDLALAPGTVTAVTGPNGGGKSTLLAIAAGVLSPTEGRVLRSPAGVVQLIPQDLRTAVVERTVRREVEFTARLAGAPDAPARAAQQLERFRLSPLADAHPLDLPAARLAEVALSAALTARPQLLVLDEPTATLDGPRLRRLLRVLDELRADGVAVLVATHDRVIPRRVADVHLECAGGRVRPA